LVLNANTLVYFLRPKNQNKSCVSDYFTCIKIVINYCIQLQNRVTARLKQDVLWSIYTNLLKLVYVLYELEVKIYWILLIREKTFIKYVK